MKIRLAFWMLIAVILIMACSAVFSLDNIFSFHCCHSDKISQQSQELLSCLSTWAPSSFFTFCLCIIGLAQAILFWWQLSLIKNGAEDTKILAKATMKSAAIAEDAFTAHERPHLFIDLSPKLFTLFDEGGYPYPIVKFDLNNFGRIPAEIIYFAINIENSSGEPQEGLEESGFHFVIEPMGKKPNNQYPIPYNIETIVDTNDEGQEYIERFRRYADSDILVRINISYLGIGKIAYETACLWIWDYADSCWRKNNGKNFNYRT